MYDADDRQMRWPMAHPLLPVRPRVSAAAAAATAWPRCSAAGDTLQLSTSGQDVLVLCAIRRYKEQWRCQTLAHKAAVWHAADKSLDKRPNESRAIPGARSMKR